MKNLKHKKIPDDKAAEITRIMQTYFGSHEAADAFHQGVMDNMEWARDIIKKGQRN